MVMYLLLIIACVSTFEAFLWVYVCASHGVRGVHVCLFGFVLRCAESTVVTFLFSYILTTNASNSHKSCESFSIISRIIQGEKINSNGNPKRRGPNKKATSHVEKSCRSWTPVLAYILGFLVGTTLCHASITSTIGWKQP